MAKWFLLTVLILAAVLGAAYYLAYQPLSEALDAARQQALDNAARLERESDALKGQIADLEAMQKELTATSAELEAELQAREAELVEVRSTQADLLTGLQQEIADGQVQIERLQNRLRVDVVDQILFDSGETTLKPQGREVLGKVAAVLVNANRRIEVQGHTDNVPIVGRLAETYPTNWELSAARAVNVARFLQDEAGIDPRTLSAAGLSEYHPRASNDTEEGRRQNRRIEILLAPMVEITENPQ